VERPNKKSPAAAKRNAAKNRKALEKSRTYHACKLMLTHFKKDLAKARSTQKSKIV